MHRSPATHHHVAIIGSGFGGLGTAIRLRQHGIHDFVVLERADDVGGVWRDNQYPGCACDVESHLYSFSFALNPDWSRAFSPQPEIWSYLRDCAERYGVLPHIRFGTEVRGAAWDDEAQRWQIETTAGAYTAAVLVWAGGALSEPAIPDLPGLQCFRGAAFHSARWDHSLDLAGLHVAVIGTGSSAIQFVPVVQRVAARLYVFQRTAPWIIPSRDRPLREAERRLFRRVPAAQRLARGLIYAIREAFGVAFRHPRMMTALERLARRHLEASVPDPALRARLTPSYTVGCKRILISDDYLPALTRSNVELVTDGIAEVRERSIVTRDGIERPVDAVIFATGFHVTDFPFAGLVRGRGGRTLSDVWGGSPKAHVGTTVAGFPNLFLLQGPNTGLGHTSVIYMIEAQIAHVLGAIHFMRTRGAAAVEPRPDAQAAFVADVDERMRGTVWVTGGCKSWYLDATGRSSALWPGSPWSFRRRVARFRPDEYLIARRSRARPVARPTAAEPAAPAASR